MSTFAAQEGLAGIDPVYFNPEALDRGFVRAPEKLTDDGRVDEVTVAASLMWPGANSLTEGFTYFEGVRRLKPGDAANIVEGRLEIHSQWPHENSYVTFDGTATKVRGLLDEALGQVVAANPNEVSSDCSGGYDSTALALIAATLCTQDTDILGLVQHSTQYPAGDIQYARAAAKLDKRLTLHEIQTTERELPFTQKPWQGLSPSEPYRGMAIFARESTRLNVARRYHLVGDGADALFDPDPIPILADLISQGEHADARNLAMTVGRALLRRPADIFSRAEALARTDLSQSYERVARQLRVDGLQCDTDWLPELGIASTWLTPTVREALAARATEFARKAPDVNYAAFATKSAIRDSGDAHRHLRFLAEKCGVTIVAPYLGDAVLKSVLELPTAARIRPGEYKPLLYKAVPSLIRRDGKGSYSGEMQAGYENLRPRLETVIRNSRLARMGIIDPDAVVASLWHKRPPTASVAQLLATESWLESLGFEPAAHRSSAPASPSVSATLPEDHYRKPVEVNASLGSKNLLGFHTDTGRFMNFSGLNQTTKLITQTLLETGSSDVALQRLRALYPSAPVSQLTADITTVLGKLTESGWLEPTDDESARIRQVLTLKLPEMIARETTAYIRSLKQAGSSVDAHHYASAISGSPEDMLAANARAAETVGNGRELETTQLKLGARGVIGVLRSKHGNTHGLHSVIGLGSGWCIGLVAQDGNLGVMQIDDLLRFHRKRLDWMGFPGDVSKIKFYAEQ